MDAISTPQPSGNDEGSQRIQLRSLAHRIEAFSASWETARLDGGGIISTRGNGTSAFAGDGGTTIAASFGSNGMAAQRQTPPLIA